MGRRQKITGFRDKSEQAGASTKGKATPHPASAPNTHIPHLHTSMSTHIPQTYPQICMHSQMLTHIYMLCTCSHSHTCIHSHACIYTFNPIRAVFTYMYMCSHVVVLVCLHARIHVCSVPMYLYTRMHSTHMLTHTPPTLIRCLLTHLVKVFFCTRSRSSGKNKAQLLECYKPPGPGETTRSPQSHSQRPQRGGTQSCSPLHCLLGGVESAATPRPPGQALACPTAHPTEGQAGRGRGKPCRWKGLPRLRSAHTGTPLPT